MKDWKECWLFSLEKKGSLKEELDNCRGKEQTYLPCPLRSVKKSKFEL